MKIVANLKTVLLLLFVLSTSEAFSQMAYNKEWSKDIAVYQAKEYLLKNVFDSSTEPVKFAMHALAASKSGELTSVVYDCPSQKKEGLLFGFYEDYVNEHGLKITSYGFKDFSKSKGLELLNKVEKIISDNDKYLKGNAEESNLYFQFDDIIVLIIGGNTLITTNPSIRIFWKNYDADWDYTAFSKTKHRILKQE